MIVRQKPVKEEELIEADLAWFESDADDNIVAIKEIDAQAAQYGLIRTREYWLPTFSYEGRVVRRGFCYRPETADMFHISRRMAEMRQNDVVGASSAQIIREMRDGEA